MASHCFGKETVLFWNRLKSFESRQLTKTIIYKRFEERVGG